MSVNNKDIYSAAIDKFIASDQKFMIDIQNSIYTGEQKINSNDIKVIDNRLKLLTGLVIFLLTKLSEKEKFDSQPKIAT